MNAAYACTFTIKKEGMGLLIIKYFIFAVVKKLICVPWR